MLKKFLFVTVVTCLLLVTASMTVGAATLSADEILTRVDGNAFMESGYLSGRLIIKARRREITKEFESWMEGQEKALVTFLNPGDRGTKYLKINDELWMFFPDAEDLVKISGHMLKQGMMGSDYSYQDAMESEKLTELYEFRLLAEGNLDGNACYVLEASALPGKTVSYAQRKLWVDKDRFVILREELYAASGKLLKVARAEEVQKVDGHIYATRTVMENKLREGSSTTFIVDEIKFDMDIPEGTFSLRSLMR